MIVVVYSVIVAVYSVIVAVYSVIVVVYSVIVAVYSVIVDKSSVNELIPEETNTHKGIQYHLQTFNCMVYCYQYFRFYGFFSLQAQFCH